VKEKRIKGTSKIRRENLKTLLLVDDNDFFRRSLSIGLEDEGYTVYEAGSGMEALEFLQSKHKKKLIVDTVIVDARMPGLDGFLLYDQIHSMDPSVKVIILSAHSYPEQTDKYTMLTKPVSIPELVDSIENYLFLQQG